MAYQCFASTPNEIIINMEIKTRNVSKLSFDLVVWPILGALFVANNVHICPCVYNGFTFWFITIIGNDVDFLFKIIV